MNKFLRSLTIISLIVIILVLLVWIYVISILPVKSESGSNMMILLWGFIAAAVVFIIVTNRVSKEKSEIEYESNDKETSDFIAVEKDLQTVGKTGSKTILDPKKEKSRLIFLILIAVSMIVIAIVAFLTIS